jgi:N-acylglucosamine 2-epimerase
MPAADHMPANTLDTHGVANRYRRLLLDGIVPFWFEHGIDWECGGVLSCMQEDGALVSTEKFIWSQARSVWTFAALYNRVEPRPEFLRAAENSVRFLLEHGRDARGRWVYRTDRSGNVLEGATSIYTDCFVVYGLSEYVRATGEHQLLDLARNTYDFIRQRVEQPDFHETAPYELPSGWKNHGVPMILAEVTNELIITTGDSTLEPMLDLYIDRVMNKFLRPERKVILEFLDSSFHELPAPAGTFVMPGHAIESMWFMLHVARRRNDVELTRRAAEAMKWHLEFGWDQEFGGLYLSRDLHGQTPYMPNGEMKIWWPHTEALYGTLLAYAQTGDHELLDWFKRLESWAWKHFPMSPSGEWYQRLTRRGEPTTRVIALPVKDPFHLPRAAILLMQLANSLSRADIPQTQVGSRA